jgi:transposase-like protein
MYGELNTMAIERRVFVADFNFGEDRRSYSAEFKAKVALEALKNDKTHLDIAQDFTIHPYQVNLWKHHLLNNVVKIFESNTNPLQSVPNPPERHHAKIGQLIAENDFLTKVLGK